MKVLVVHNAYQSRHVGGEDVVVRREVKGLKTILGEENVLEYQVSNDDAHPLKLLFTLWGNKIHYNNIKNMVQMHHIDIVHVHNFFPLLTPLIFKAAKQGGAKVIHTLHNFRWWCLSGVLYRKNAGICEKCTTKTVAWPAMYHRCYRSSFVQSLAGVLAFAWYKFKKYQKYIDAYFVLSQFQKEKLKNVIQPEKLLLKPNGIENTQQAILPEMKKNYVFVGRLESAKGIEVLLSTWRQLPSHFHLDIIGTGEEFAYFERTFAGANICFLGKLPQEEVFIHMRKAKYVLQPSMAYETFGLTIIEAFSQGTPVIGFQRGSRAELIESEKNGFLCETAQLKDTLLRSYDYADYAALSKAAFTRAKDFDLSLIMQKQVILYQQVLAHE